jgi:CheY-like chemotaxis protein
MLGEDGTPRDVTADGSLLRGRDYCRCHRFPYRSLATQATEKNPRSSSISTISAVALILIIDDSSYQRTALRDLLRGSGYHTVEAADGREGLERLAKFDPDCIVTDLLMPRLGGLELLEILNDKQNRTPIIVITSSRQKDVRQRCLDLGAAAFINKPVKEAQLLAVVRSALA